MRRRKTDEVLWLALVYAKEDRQYLIDAYNGDGTQQAVKDARADIKAFESLQLRLFGTTETELDSMMANTRPVSLQDLRNMLRDDFNPDGPLLP